MKILINVAKSTGGLHESLLADRNLLEDAETLTGNVLWEHYWWSNHLWTPSWITFRLSATKIFYKDHEVVFQSKNEPILGVDLKLIPYENANLADIVNEY